MSARELGQGPWVTDFLRSQPHALFLPPPACIHILAEAEALETRLSYERMMLCYVATIG